MLLTSNLALAPVSHASKVAERLLAHARLCREIAGATWNEETAKKLERLADDCTRAATEIAPAPGGEAPLH
jgi:hypothetical protein